MDLRIPSIKEKATTTWCLKATIEIIIFWGLLRTKSLQYIDLTYFHRSFCSHKGGKSVSWVLNGPSRRVAGLLTLRVAWLRTPRRGKAPGAAPCCGPLGGARSDTASRRRCSHSQGRRISSCLYRLNVSNGTVWPKISRHVSSSATLSMKLSDR